MHQQGAPPGIRKYPLGRSLFLLFPLAVELLEEDDDLSILVVLVRVNILIFFAGTVAAIEDDGHC